MYDTATSTYNLNKSKVEMTRLLSSRRESLDRFLSNFYFKSLCSNMLMRGCLRTFFDVGGRGYGMIGALVFAALVLVELP